MTASPAAVPGTQSSIKVKWVHVYSVGAAIRNQY